MAELDKEEKKLNLYQKISEITASLGVIQKDSTAPTTMGGYKFLSHAMMLAHLRTELTSRNVVIIPSGEELLRREVTEKKTTDSNGKEKISFNFFTVIKFNFTVIDGDNPSDFFNAYWIGEGMDSSDKGVQKAGTSAEKYFLMKLFKVGDKDDPDAAATDSTSETKSMSATINSNAVPNTKPTVTGTVVEQTLPDSKPTEVPVSQIPSNDGASPDLYKKQTDALIWFGEQLPSSAGWFKGKIIPMMKMYEAKEKKGTLNAEEKNAGSSVKWIFGEIAASHYKTCGEDCPHIGAVQMAIVLGGTIHNPK